MNLLRDFKLSENKNISIFCFLFFISSYICLTNCLIEIPFTAIEVKNIPKYKDIEVKEPLDFSKLDKSNITMFYTDGSIVINKNFLFLAHITIGSNNQPFNLLLDTGSHVLWVAEENCKETSKIPITNHYAPSKSTTKKTTTQSFEITYGTGSVQGFYYYDYAKYINNKQFWIKFGAAKKADFAVYNCDGIIGLSHDYSSNNEISFIHMLKKANIIDSTKFSFKFIGENSGKLILGEHDDFSKSNAVTAPLITLKGEANLFWVCEVSGFGLVNTNEQIKSLKSYNIIFDTGTNFILLPIQYYYDMKEKLKDFGCTTTYKEKDIQLVCSNYNTLPDFIFIINGHTLTLSKYYSIYLSNDSKYYSSILFVKEERYIIGSPFFVAFHTLFDKENEQLHFYPEENSTIDKDSYTSSVVALIVIIILLILFLGFLIYRWILWRRAKRELNDIPSSNYNYNNF